MSKGVGPGGESSSTKVERGRESWFSRFAIVERPTKNDNMPLDGKESIWLPYIMACDNKA